MEIVLIDSDSDSDSEAKVEAKVEIISDVVEKKIIKNNDNQKLFDMYTEKKSNMSKKAMEIEINQISKIRFGMYSSEEIEKLAVCEITNVKLSGRGSVYDTRMGVIESDRECESCGKSSTTCTGHFGYISLNTPILHPLAHFRSVILNFLRMFCDKCSTLLVTGDQVRLRPDINKLSGQQRFNAMLSYCIGVGTCPLCDSTISKFKYTDGKFYIHSSSKKKADKKHLTAVDIQTIFSHVTNESVDMIGIDSSMMHPSNLIITNLLVCPPSARPSLVDDGQMCDDDLTAKYLEIMKQNLKLVTKPVKKGRGRKKVTPIDKERCIQYLEFHLKTLMDNSDSKAKLTNGRPVKSIKQRMNGKGNLIRNNLLGKRVDFSGRSVAGPDSSLRMNEVGLPAEVMDNLSIPHIVYKFNKKYLEDAVRNGKTNGIIRNGKIYSSDRKVWTESTRLKRNDMVVRGSIEVYAEERQKGDTLYIEDAKRNDVKKYIRGGRVFNPFDVRDFAIVPGDKIIRGGVAIKTNARVMKKFNLRYGDKVEMKYRNGDPILINRQPTLHGGSMMVFKAKRLPGKTFRIPLCVSKSYNCDFDGDELNVHAPQDIMSVVECKELCNVGSIMMSCKSNNSIICMVQDALIGSYLMTFKNEVMDKGEFFDITMKCDNGKSVEVSGLDVDYVLDGVERYIDVMKCHGKYTGNKYTSNCLWSLILPPDFHYQMKTDGKEDEPVLRIERGIIYEGVLTKRVLGSGHNGLIQTIYKEYGQRVAMTFVSNVQFITDAWLLTYGFSIGLKDCFSNRANIIKTIDKCIDDAEVADATSRVDVKEAKINLALNKARDVGIKISASYMTETNPLRMMIVSGAKGDYVNIAQISGLLGQQNISGRRVQPNLSSGSRTLSQYKFSGNSKLDKYESQGFISSSFSIGLNPREYFFHAMSGREGLVNTACKTAISGYIQRRMTKFMEDLKIANDLTVRDPGGSIIQFNYGNDNCDPSMLLKLKHGLSFINVKRLATRLNKKFEYNKRIQHSI